MPAASAVANDVFDVVGSNVSVVYAPGSINLLGEDYASSDGILLAIAIPAHVAVGIEEIDEQQLVVVYRRETTRMDFPDSVPAAFSQVPTAVAVAIVALQHSLHLAPCNSNGLKVTIASTIAPGHGFGETPAIQYALTLALSARSDDRDDVPTRMRITTALHETMVQIKGQSWPLYPYTTAPRNHPDSLLCINHSDEVVTQMAFPQSLALIVVYSPDVTGDSPDEGHYESFQQACATLGVPTLAGLPDSQEQAADQVRARHGAHPNGEDIPTIGHAIQWLDNADASSDRVRAVIGHIRHSDIQAAIAGVSRDVSERGSVLSASSVLGQTTELIDTIDCEKIVRCAPCPGAPPVMRSHADDVDRIASAFNDGGSEAIHVENTLASAVVEQKSLCERAGL